jgi:hypothetical protein
VLDLERGAERKNLTSMAIETIETIAVLLAFAGNLAFVAYTFGQLKSEVKNLSIQIEMERAVTNFKFDTLHVAFDKLATNFDEFREHVWKMNNK